MLAIRAALLEDRDAVNKLWRDGDVAIATDDQWLAITSVGSSRLQ